MSRTPARARLRPGAEQGFSPLELTVAVGVLLVLLAIAVPSVQGLMDSYRLDSAQSMLASKLVETRMNALKRNRAVWLQVDAQEGRVQVLTSGPGGKTLKIGAPGLLPAGVEFVPPVPSIRFDSIGRPANPPPCRLGVESLTSHARRSVSVSAAGTVSRG
jgi:type II secretory pathway pseudopilin PulG